jgi:secondary thiamine-phosphate synthase enzyme
MQTLRISLNTKGNTDIIDLTGQLQELIKKEKISDGVLFLSVIGSTAALTTMEYEPGLIKDLKATCDTLMPYSLQYSHNATWDDDNGHSHIRSSLLKTSLFVSVTHGVLDLGTWQQVVLLDFDTRARNREIVIKVLQ